MRVPPQHGQQFQSAHRLALSIVLVVVIAMLIPEIRGYVDLVVNSTRASRAIAAQRTKLSATDLESLFARARRLPPNADFRCRPAARDWDYVCSYMPTPLQSKTRVEMGFIVDERRWLNVSRIVPEGTTIPPPR